MDNQWKPTDSPRHSTEEGLDSSASLDVQTAAMDSVQTAKTHPSPRQWKSAWRPSAEPMRVFLLLTIFHMFVYLDRGSIATNAVNGHQAREDEETSGFRAELEMSNLQNGFLSSLCMIGRLVGCLITPRLSRSIPPLVVIGCGMVIWIVAIASCGLSFNFYTLAACRLLAGIGQAPLSTIGTIIIDDVAPEEKVSTWFSIFEGAGPVGAAVGFFYGSFVGTRLSWKYAFYFLAITAIPPVIYCFLMKRFDLKQTADQQEGKPDSEKTLWIDMKQLMSNIVLDFSIVGMSLHKGYIVCMEYWAARGFEAVFRTDNVDMTLAIVLITASVIGSLAGGRLLDTTLGATIPASLCLCGGSLFVVSGLSIPAALALRSYFAFIAVFSVSFLFVFIPLGPASAATLWAAPEELRPISRSMSVVLQQILGGIPAPMLYGAVVDWTERTESETNAHRVAIVISTLFVCGATVLFFIAAIISSRFENDKETHPPV